MMAPAPAVLSESGFPRRPAWLLALAAVMLSQVSLGVQWLGVGVSFDSPAWRVPVTAGEHPLHQYHAGLGAKAFRESRSATCYDVNFQAGYPKSPVFDAAARPVEPLFLAFGGVADEAVLYKWFLLLELAAVPLVCAGMALGFRLDAGMAVLASAASVVLMWTPQGRVLFEAGDHHLIGLGLAVLLFLGGLARYATQPGLTGWFMLAAASVVGWAVHPLGWGLMLPAVAVFYIFNAPRYGLAWHLGAVGILAVGLGANMWWLADWLNFWWMRESVTDDVPLRSAVPCHLVATTSMIARCGVPMLALALLGFALMIRNERRGSVAMLLCTIAGAAALSQLAERWSWLQREGANHAPALLPGLLLVPAAFAVHRVTAGMKIRPVLVIAAVAMLAAFSWNPHWQQTFAWEIPVLTSGWNPAQLHQQQVIAERTTREARILLEDDRSCCQALLPVLTDRLFVGALDATRLTEFCELSQTATTCFGQPMHELSVADQQGIIRQYNLGWVFCQTPAVEQFWRRVPGSRVVGRGPNAHGVLIALLHTPSFALSGQAKVEVQSPSCIVLTDVVPDRDGLVKLSFHYHKSLRAAPMVQEVLPEKHLHDATPFITLRVPGGITRVVLSWERY